MKNAEHPSSPTLPPVQQASLFWVTVIGIAAAALLALATASQTYLSMRTHGHSYLRILLWQLGCWSFWAAVAPWAVRASSRLALWRLTAIGVILTCAQAVLAALLAIWLQPYLPFTSYSFTDAIENLWWFVILANPVVYVLLLLGGRAFEVYERGKRLELRQSQLEAQLARAQLDTLRLEIQPHFLFNTLNSIAALIRVNDSPGALTMLIGLSDLMRTTLDESHGALSTLAREVRLIQRYVDLQRARFGDRLHVTFAIDPACEPASVPSLVLQPLVENAFRHGLAPLSRAGHIIVSASPGPGGTLCLRVSDDGVGVPPGFDLARHAGTGLRNTRARLERMYGSAATMTVTSDAGVTMVELRFPSQPAADAVQSGAA
jgi:sensor histidine kinase YesM